MGKDKLRRFKELEGFSNVFQSGYETVFNKDHALKSHWHKEFKNTNPIVLELACGKGEFTISGALENSKANFIGIDIKGNRLHRGAKFALEHKLDNVRFLRTRIDFISSFFAENEVDDIWIIFPDPQPQKNRARKRLTSDIFLERYKHFLSPTGRIHLKTDNQGFYDFTKAQIKTHNFILEVDQSDIYSQPIHPKIPPRVYTTKTHYEKLFLKQNKTIKYLRFKLSTK